MKEQLTNEILFLLDREIDFQVTITNQKQKNAVILIDEDQQNETDRNFFIDKLKYRPHFDGNGGLIGIFKTIV